jgi:hypothetical protein
MDPSAAKVAPPSGNAADHVLLIPPDHPPPPHAGNSNQQSPSAAAAEATKPSQNPEKPPVVSSPSRPPLPPTLLRRRSSIATPKSRFVEPPPPTPLHPDSTHPAPVHPAAAASLNGTPTHRGAASAAGVSTPHTPGDADDEEDLFRNRDGSRSPAAAARCRRRVCLGLELSVLVLVLAVLVVSVVVRSLRGRVIWGLEIWKWCVMVTAVFSGHLLSRWLVTLIVFIVERNFLLRTKVLYFVFGLKKSFQVCLWLALVLIAWSQLFDQGGAGRSQKTARILNYVSRFLASMLIGSVIWLVKTFLMKLVASTFHRKTFFDRIQESVFHQYVLQTLSGPPLMELAENVGREGSGLGRVSFSRAKEEKEKGVPEAIDVVKLRRMSQEKVSAWTMRGLVTAIRSSRLSTISNTIESFNDVNGMEQKDREINSEWEAKAAAYAIFKNVARPGYK